MEPNEREELQWLAFRYVAGEMNAAEAEAWERRLADDQAARDAVCQGVALTGRLAAASPHNAGAREADFPPTTVTRGAVPKSSRHAALRALGWMSLGAAAALVSVMLANPGVLLPSGSDVPTQVIPARPSANALVWARLHTASQWADELH
ncbi:MAG: hypothetical protein L0099_11470, partial [Acidobacteria bacterium]|nr:hypothetical protein [Acidobacteriota bacterium]